MEYLYFIWNISNIFGFWNISNIFRIVQYLWNSFNICIWNSSNATLVPIYLEYFKYIWNCSNIFGIFPILLLFQYISKMVKLEKEKKRSKEAAILALKKNIVPNFNLGDLLGPFNKILRVKNAPHLVYQFFRHLS